MGFEKAGSGFNRSLEEIEEILAELGRTEGNAEVVQFSGGEPSIHPQIVPMLRAAKARNIRYVMLNTNGKRIAKDDAFLAELAEIRPTIYFQFDGFEPETYRVLRGEPDILAEKFRARCNSSGYCSARRSAPSSASTESCRPSSMRTYNCVCRRGARSRTRY